MLYKKVIYKLFALMLVLLSVSSCKKESDNDIVPIDPNDTVVSFEKDVQPIFDQNCISCHPNSGGMSLIAGESYNSLVNVVSPNYHKVRVSPFFADSSVICFKLHGVDGYGFMMPLNGIPLEDSEIDTIEDWIDQGALDN